MKGSGTINFRGVDMTVEFYYEPFKRETRDDPAQGEFYIESVKIGGVEVIELLEPLYSVIGLRPDNKRIFNPIIQEIESQYIKENFKL